MRKLITILLCLLLHHTYAQQSDSTIVHIEEVTIRAYHSTSILATSAAVNTIDSAQLNRFGNTNILPAINATPGVRMEERSPGSYRLSIRGSSLRAPYGVRNVKIYYNDIPFTDPSGFSYLNQLGFHNIQSLEILKGPGSSVYGAGTGGVMLINSRGKSWQRGAEAGYTVGSYGLHHAYGELRFGKGIQNTVRYQHLQSDGYREHSRMSRDVVSWDAQATTGEYNTLSAHFLYSDLYYQTPGAITLQDYNQDPRKARPAAGSFPSAQAANAAIDAQLIVTGFTNEHRFSGRLKNTTTLYGIYSQLRNPTVQNYAHSTDPHFGGRTVFTWQIPAGSSWFDVLTGIEAQQGYTTLRVYNNRKGDPDSLQTDDAINTRQYFGFVQASWKYSKWMITAGASVNKQSMDFERRHILPSLKLKKEFDFRLAPRLAVLYRVTDKISVYANIANGFSPPTTAEMLPDRNLNYNLQAEAGWNYEAGSRGYALNNKLYYDISVFRFSLQNTIVVRRNAGGGNNFINAGDTRQTGLEAYLKYNIINKKDRFIERADAWVSYAYYHFRYGSFMQGTDDYSGNDLPGVAPHTVTFGFDLYTRHGMYTNTTYSYTDAIPLNDANTAYTGAYNLLTARVGYRHWFKEKYMLEIFAGADNILDEQYSLGNDINGFGGRYYNAASARNYFIGLAIGCK